jgi:very-short-patch-repair endonuclease
MVQPVVPKSLTECPFTFAEAKRVGLSRRQLRGASWRRIGFGWYVWAGLKDTPELTLAPVHDRLPVGAAFSGRTAAWLHGLDFAPDSPVEVAFPSGPNNSKLAGASVRRVLLPASDLVVRRGLLTTSALRTVFDLGARPPLIEAVVALDMALHAGLVHLPELRDFAASHAGSKGARQFKQAVALAEPLAEAPMETRLRMLLVMSRLPRPEAQVSLHDDQRRFLGRVDLYYPAHRLAIEYDGGTHRTSLVEDNRRQNQLLNAGFRLLRFALADIRETPTSLVDQVRHALASTQVTALRRQAK